jgi:hypothetical protein
MEFRVSLETVMSRLPGLRIAVPDADLAWLEGTVMGSLTALPERQVIRWTLVRGSA